MKKPSDQSGLTIVELMIALVLSSFLIIGISQIYIDNKRSQGFQVSQLNNLENSRFSALVLDQYLAKAGYRRNPAALIEMTFPARSASGDCMEFKAGQTVTKLLSSAGQGFCLRYQPQASGEFDCQGNSSSVSYSEAFPNIDLDEQFILAFKYEASSTSDLSKGRLLCKNLNATSPQYSELLSGIADFRLEFGIGSNDVLDKQVKNFIKDSDWTTNSGTINSIRYNILLTSRARLRDSEDSLILANWLSSASDAAKARLNTHDDRNLYQVAGSTQTLRNLMP